MASLALRSGTSQLAGAQRARCSKRTPLRVACSAGQVAPTSQYTRVRLKARSDCELFVSWSPKFKYNALGGGGWGTVTDLGDGKLQLTFDPSTLVIPDLSFRTAYLFGLLPIPPPLNIAIRPAELQGVLDTRTGEMNLSFKSDFHFSAGSFYVPPSLRVECVLTTETSQGPKLGATGKRLVNNSGILVGSAPVSPVGDAFLDTFLQLPNDALAVMSCDFFFE
ncbi:hypothetical protein HYH03_008142 [Edaphochlamys debaryana]|uniref:Uncharacterized protein n=1 Tax=Edaphochlamys debaryana TaxID=47281 RepID=A0A835Y721_9CHLO|nr:hypothetical protein HYH03_008142 [Edaphochlamys debaryana]|eukprot:KAG2493625.1 hypothetical protein HYH03_008142 [Edaphochlamys debaryana]